MISRDHIDWCSTPRHRPEVTPGDRPPSFGRLYRNTLRVYVMRAARSNDSSKEIASLMHEYALRLEAWSLSFWYFELS